MTATALEGPHYRALAFLRRGALVRDRGEWRFGGARVADHIVERLIEQHRVTRMFPNQTGDCIVLLDRSRGVGR